MFTLGLYFLVLDVIESAEIWLGSELGGTVSGRIYCQVGPSCQNGFESAHDSSYGSIWFAYDPSQPTSWFAVRVFWFLIWVRLTWNSFGASKIELVWSVDLNPDNVVDAMLTSPLTAGVGVGELWQTFHISFFKIRD